MHIHSRKLGLLSGCLLSLAFASAASAATIDLYTPTQWTTYLASNTPYLQQATQTVPTSPATSSAPYSGTNDFINQKNPGEIFTTGASSIALNSVIIAGVFGSTESAVWSVGFNNAALTLNISSVSTSGGITTLTTLATAVATVPGTAGENNYVAITLTSPLILSANTTYAFDVSIPSTSYWAMGTLESGGSGNAFNAASAGYTGGGTTATLLAGEDREFFLMASPVPEADTVGLLLLSGVGALGWLCKRLSRAVSA